jgi:AGCS family alanine or glycine:cation symporter
MRLRPLYSVLLAAVCTLIVASVSVSGYAQEGEAHPTPTASAAASCDPATAPSPAGTEGADQPKEEPSLIGRFNTQMLRFLFFDVMGGAVTSAAVDRDGKPVIDPETGAQQVRTIEFPFLVLVLMLGAIFFTFWYRFINVRGFKHAIDVIRGKYDNPDDEGEISHFRALTSALSATVGLGNIAGVAVAIVKGGPGAVVWMMVIATFGMTAKFSSCTLAQMYRKVNADGSISGGPMYYIDLGLKKLGGPWAPLGKVLGVMWAVMVMGAALGGGNMFQSNQTVEALTTTFDLGPDADWVIGFGMASFVAAIILGGIKRIGAATSKIVPTMVGIYVLASLVVIVLNISELPAAVALMFRMAFSENAFFGGLLGVIVTGVQRAAFSNEAGIGSAAVAHAAAKTDEPVREGMVAMVGPFIDTILVCSMTALVVIITGKWADPALVGGEHLKGAAITAAAFGTVMPWFPHVLSVSIALFAYSTMISWCYYGERGWIYLLDHFNGAGLKSVFVFRIIFVAAVVVGAVNKLEDVLVFSDVMILSMAFPNIIGSIILAPKVLPLVRDYWRRYTSGEMKTYAELKAGSPAKAE